MTMEILLANPRGFCAGVDRAIEIVERALELYGTPIYVRHEVVHNKYVVEDLRHKGAVFVEELDEVPDEAVVIFSAHGVSKAVRDEAARRPKEPNGGDDALEQAAAMVETAVGRWALSGPFKFSDVIDVNEVRNLLKDVARDIRGLKQGEDLPEMFPSVERMR